MEDLPGKAQKVAGDVQESIQELIQGWATQIPAKAQELISQLPAKITEFGSDLSVDSVLDTIEAYTQLVGSIYGSLADRGDRTWSKVRSSSLTPGRVVDAVVEAPGKAAAPKAAAPKAAAAKARATKTAAPR